MKKRGSSWIILLFVLLIMIVIICAVFGYFYIKKSYVKESYRTKISSGEIKNPAQNLNIEQAKQNFDEGFIFYLLVNINAYQLHNPPMSSDTPKIEIIVEDQKFNAEVDSGTINVKKGTISEKDIVIRTTKDEALKMMNNKSYVEQSFKVGNSQIEMINSKTTLFSKGYLGLYEDITGKSLTGSAIKIFYN